MSPMLSQLRFRVCCRVEVAGLGDAARTIDLNVRAALVLHCVEAESECCTVELSKCPSLYLRFGRLQHDRPER